MKEIFLDIETTGLSFKNGDKIVEIACIETQDLVATSNIFHKLINPERNVPEEAFKIHGFSTEFLKNKDKFSKVADEFISFIKEKKIIIHNANFDVGFLNHELNLLKKDEIKKDNVVDSLEIARSKYIGSSNSLDALCKRFGIDISRRTKHNALLDCELLREVYINLLDVKEPKLVFSGNHGESNERNNKIKNNIYSKKVIPIPDGENSKHKDFIKKEIKKSNF